MTGPLRAAYEAELAAAAAASASAQVDRAFGHLARAHILGQRFTVQHVQVHWRMLRLALSAGDRRESLGQVTRIIAAAVFSRIRVPAGNTGRANVSALRPMPVPDDLRSLLEKTGDGGKS